MKVLPIDVNFSQWYTMPGPGNSIRIGMHLVKGIKKTEAEKITAGITNYRDVICCSDKTEHSKDSIDFNAKDTEDTKDKITFPTIFSLWRSSGVSRSTLATLASSDAFRSMGLSQREALWEIKALPKEISPLDDFYQSSATGNANLPLLTAQQSMFKDYEATGFSLKGHPISFIREELDKQRVLRASHLKEKLKHFVHKEVSVAGLAIFRQRPGTAKGVVFITLEDETGIVNLIIAPKVFDRFLKTVLSSSSLCATGKVEAVGNQVYVSVRNLVSLDKSVFEKGRSSDMPSRSYSY